ncbi:hypothetical protein [Halodesulfurarchaeum formicicum]|uniref:Pentapeptide repeat-containing protein n=1 Tax=Halodesulfurarchaeum formicicum TaxID=1873524 RepID=A0A1J1AB45_9EURY|nr:hypothetical protein [Halodesulfurarchaeum formicicum]APE94959.1 hypothetical protein HSR6_0497 [Halodesulfurarchaeum formicicum]
MPNRCSFSLVLSDRLSRAADGNSGASTLPTDEDGVWRCPRIVRADRESERCVIHDPAAADEAVTREIVGAIEGTVDPTERISAAYPEEPRKAVTRCLGLDVGQIDLRRRRLSADGTYPLDLRGSNIDGLYLDESELPVPIRLDSATVGQLSATRLQIVGGIQGSNCTVQGAVDLSKSDIGGHLNFRQSQIQGAVNLDQATIDGRFDFAFGGSEGAIRAENTSFVGRFSLKEATVSEVRADKLDVTGSDPDSEYPGLQFRGLTTTGGVSIQSAFCDGHLIGYDMDIGGRFDATDATIEEGVYFGVEDGTELQEAQFHGGLDFSNAFVGGSFKFVGRERFGTDPVVGQFLDFSGGTFGRLDIAPRIGGLGPPVVNLGQSEVKRGRLDQPQAEGPVYYDLAEATLGEVTLSGDGESVANYFWFDRTTFDRFQFSESREDFAQKDWSLHRVPEHVKSQIAVAREYPTALELAIDIGTICRVQAETRRWLAEESEGPEIESLAEQVLSELSEGQIRRLARNGPESADLLGPALYARERYRVGVLTLLARELEGRETVLESLLPSAHTELQQVASATGTGEPSTISDSTDALAAAFARELGSGTDITPEIPQIETTYIMARKGADDVGDSIAAANFFINELRARRKRHRQHLLDAETPVSRLKALGDWFWNASFDLISGYGERPRRVLGTAVGSVLGFTGLYWWLGSQRPGYSEIYGGFVGSLLLSLESFTSLVLGGAEVNPVAIRLLADIEGFIGAFLIALLVFTLTRSLHR